MFGGLRILVVLLITSQQSCLGYYIRSTEESAPTKNAALQDRNDEWKAFQSKLGLTSEKVELLKSQKDQQGTKDLLHRFIKENPKYLSASNELPNTNAIKKSSFRFQRLLRTLTKNLKNSNRMLKTSFNFELADQPLKPLKRSRRKIAVKMVSDLPSERVDDLIQMFYQQHGMDSSEYSDGSNDSDDDLGYRDLEFPLNTKMDSDSDYFDYNFQDDGDEGLRNRSNQNLEYGSFLDLINQASLDQRQQENEENKLHGPLNDHFID